MRGHAVPARAHGCRRLAAQGQTCAEAGRPRRDGRPPPLPSRQAAALCRVHDAPDELAILHLQVDHQVEHEPRWIGKGAAVKPILPTPRQQRRPGRRGKPPQGPNMPTMVVRAGGDAAFWSGTSEAGSTYHGVALGHTRANGCEPGLATDRPTASEQPQGSTRMARSAWPRRSEQGRTGCEVPRSDTAVPSRARKHVDDQYDIRAEPALARSARLPANPLRVAGGSCRADCPIRAAGPASQNARPPARPSSDMHTACRMQRGRPRRRSRRGLAARPCPGHRMPGLERSSRTAGRRQRLPHAGQAGRPPAGTSVAGTLGRNGTDASGVDTAAPTCGNPPFRRRCRRRPARHVDRNAYPATPAGRADLAGGRPALPDGGRRGAAAPPPRRAMRAEPPPAADEK